MPTWLSAYWTASCARLLTAGDPPPAAEISARYALRTDSDAYYADVMADSPLAYWRLDECGGGWLVGIALGLQLGQPLPLLRFQRGQHLLCLREALVG